MPELNEKETESYIHEKYIGDSFVEDKIFTDDIIKKIYRLSNGVKDRIDILCLQYLNDPVEDKEKNKSFKSRKITSLLTKYRSFYLLLSLFLLIYIIFPFEIDSENTKQTFKIKLPENAENAENKAKFDENLLIALKEDPESSLTSEESSLPAIQNNPKISNYNYNESNDAQGLELEAATQTQDKKDSGSIEILENSDVIINDEKDIETSEESENFKKDIDWLVGQQPDKYVLQLISAIKRETIKNYLAFFGNSNEPIIEFTASVNGKKRYILLYGPFDDYDLAYAQIEKLPQKARQIKPWVRTVKSIKELVE